jgi:hypothetical protein
MRDSGLIWVALPSCRNRILDASSPRPPLLRKIARAIPKRLQPKEKATVWVQAYDSDGTLVHDLQRRWCAGRDTSDSPDPAHQAGFT